MGIIEHVQFDYQSAQPNTHTKVDMLESTEKMEIVEINPPFLLTSP